MISPNRVRSALRVAALACGLTVLAAACGSDQPETAPGGSGERPETPATLSFLSPAPNEVTGPDVTVELRLENASVVARTSGDITPDEGHIHLSLDGRLVSMTDSTMVPLTDLDPGRHTLEADFVAIDHAPFSNRVRAAVLFEVAP